MKTMIIKQIILEYLGIVSKSKQNVAFNLIINKTKHVWMKLCLEWAQINLIKRKKTKPSKMHVPHTKELDYFKPKEIIVIEHNHCKPKKLKSYEVVHLIA